MTLGSSAALAAPWCGRSPQPPTHLLSHCFFGALCSRRCCSSSFQGCLVTLNPQFGSSAPAAGGVLSQHLPAALLSPCWELCKGNSIRSRGPRGSAITMAVPQRGRTSRTRGLRVRGLHAVVGCRSARCPCTTSLIIYEKYKNCEGVSSPSVSDVTLTYSVSN